MSGFWYIGIMRFSIDRNIFATFPGLHLGVVEARGIDNAGSSTELMELVRAQQERIRATMSLGSYSEDPRFVAWQEAYGAFGGKPKKYRCSVENLYRMTLEGMDLRHINTLVDLYNLVSLKHKLPVGGDDLDRIEGDIRLTFATGEESFVILGAEGIDHPKPGEVIYRDDKEVLCRRWNWRECDKTKMAETTKNALLVVEGLPPATKEDVTTATKELMDLIEHFCGGKGLILVLGAG
ncbi:TPA: hypothetical protein DDZ10_00015 [Candidatus Uhrbacteria bacterium]|uniref:Lysine-tRNA ligase n=1 Tax=Candidatus Uhrbacteria bacterium GW2011_GWC2_53_7 TaxID=1618986 RepID=A0A0G2AUZ2_9BACT|nr:MAG: Lysine-tRNA ligase [Candidatus Uhrbacteria bacterium GW2011_GWC2_53_7]HBL39053.1 hypothetical protein [Candidatus Uhrbacteria bacterium]